MTKPRLRVFSAERVLAAYGRGERDFRNIAVDGGPFASDFRNRSLVGADFSGSAFHEVSFHGTDLMRSCFRGATIEYCSFWNARLVAADLSEAGVTGTSFEYADLSRACLDQARFHAFRTGVVDHQGWDEWEDTCFNDAVLSRASARGARFGAHMLRADCRHMDATGASFQDAELGHADFRGAILDEAFLQLAEGIRLHAAGGLPPSAFFDEDELAGAPNAWAPLSDPDPVRRAPVPDLAHDDIEDRSRENTGPPGLSVLRPPMPFEPDRH